MNKNKGRNLGNGASYTEASDEGVPAEVETTEQELDTSPAEVQENVIELNENTGKHTYGNLVTSVDLSTVFSKVSASGSICLETLLRYTMEMGKGIPQTVKSGSNYQQMLFGALDTLFNRLDDADFGLIYNAFLLIVSEHTGKGDTFHEEMVYRFSEEWPMDDVERVAFRRWVTMITITANPSTRAQELRNIPRFDTFLDFGLTDSGKQRLRNFYRLI